MNEKQKPSIRFKGFTEAWKQRKVIEMFEVTRGYVLAATLTEANRTDETPYPIYSSQTRDNGLMGYYKDYLYEDAITWTTDGANAGTVNYRAGKFYCTNVCGVLLSNEVKANQMIAEALNNVAKRYVSYVGNPKLMNNVMADIEIQIPVQSKEREQISHFLATLDCLIILHQRKYDKLVNVKKSMLEKMFPRDEKNVPEIRFSGFTEAWEQRKLGEIAGRTYGGGTPSTSRPEYWNGNIPWIQSSNLTEYELFNSNIQKYITNEGLAKSAAQLIPSNSIAVVSHVGVGKLVFMPFHYTTSQDFISLSELKAEPIFICYSVYKRLQNDIHIVQGSAIKGITKDDLLSKEILLPNEPEQNKIAKYFSNLDHLIILRQREVEKLQNIKKSCLEKMFI